MVEFFDISELPPARRFVVGYWLHLVGANIIMKELYYVYLAITIPLVIAFCWAYYEIGQAIGYW